MNQSHTNDRDIPGKIFIGGLPKETGYDEFNNHFGKYGDITDSVIMKDRNGQPRGFGFITYADPLVVDKVIEDTHVFSGKQVEIKRTIPRGTADSKDFKTKKIFVGGIPTSLGEDELATFFSKYGKVVEHQIVRDHGTNRSRGFGFVVFDSEEVVDELISKGNMIDMSGNQVLIKKAEPKEASNPPSGSRSRSRSFPDKFSGYDGAYDSFDGRYIVDDYPCTTSGGPGYYDGVGLRHRRYAPWHAFEGPGIPNDSRFGPYGALGGTGSGYSPYDPERVRYGKGINIGDYGDCDGYLAESSSGDASRFGSGVEYDRYDGAYYSFDGRYGPGPIRASRVPDIVDDYPYRAFGGLGYYDGVGLHHRRYAPWHAFEGPGIPNDSRFGPYGALGGTGSGYTPYDLERVRYGKGINIGDYGDCDGYLGESSRGDASRFGSGVEYDPYRGSNIRAGGGPAASYGGSYGSGSYSGGKGGAIMGLGRVMATLGFFILILYTLISIHIL